MVVVHVLFLLIEVHALRSSSLLIFTRSGLLAHSTELLLLFL
jgi:uncharacterized membrane protein YwzB